MPKLDDLTVYRKNEEVLEIWSHLTRGRCATAYKFNFSKNVNIVPFLTSTYMQGITHELMREAVDQFLANEASSQT